LWRRRFSAARRAEDGRQVKAILALEDRIMHRDERGRMIREVGAVIGIGHNVLYWHQPDDRSAALLPDSRVLWEVFRAEWAAGRLLGFAHSHTGGYAGPSREDISSFVGMEDALGFRLFWWIVTDDRTAQVQWANDLGTYVTGFRTRPYEPPWVDELRARSRVQ
jgi:hypothetical protein